MEEKKKKVKVIEDVHIKNKHTDDLVDHYWGSINYVASLIKASEIKAGLILSFYGILLNFIYQGITLLLEQFPNNVLIYILLVLWFGFIVVSIYFSIRCFIPRFEAKFDKNIFFFRDVITKFGDVDEFSKTFFEISKDEDRLFHQLGHQIYIVSKIANVKFRYVHLSLRFLAASLVVLLIASIYYFVISAV
ncbi:ABC transporter ATP-binding protein [Paucihalobacter ruber]|uniref:ABC transporter ATP-binding protein n=1 Tax=Paucihalobacter ruber TaxID=2567861 RepID=A0A506PK52_9FLAO|nr:Pycsar system effector family protein [Paucihalobacter ruber]TPV32750.1 ABC transporter ATP-binding protein [Paucihalobacter ruber]